METRPQTLGIARAGLDTLIGLARTKISVDSGSGLGAQPSVQALIARRSAALDAARDHLRRRTTDLWTPAQAGANASLEQVGALWALAHHAVDAATSAVDDAYAACGTTSLYTDRPLERGHRDLHAMLRHVVAQPAWLEDAGKVTLGMAPSLPLYAI